MTLDGNGQGFGVRQLLCAIAGNSPRLYVVIRLGGGLSYSFLTSVSHLDVYLLLEYQPNVDSTAPATGAVSVAGRRKKSIVTAGGGVRVVMTISIRISTRPVAILAGLPHGSPKGWSTAMKT